MSSTTEGGRRLPARAAGDWVGLAFRLTLGIVLIIAGGLKIGDLDQSVRAVKAYRLLSPEIADLVGVALPPLEILLGVLLVVGLFVRVTAIISGLLMAVFIAGIISVWVRGISIECGCFNSGGDLDGPINQYEYAREIFRDLALIGMAAWLAVRPRTAFSLDAVVRPHLHRHPHDLHDDDLHDDDLHDDDLHDDDSHTDELDTDDQNLSRRN